MPKSWYKLKLHFDKTFKNFSKFVTDFYYENNRLCIELESFEKEGFIEKYYFDFHGWEHILYKTNGDIPFLWVCMHLCHINNITHKLARYQMFELCKIYNIQTDE